MGNKVYIVETDGRLSNRCASSKPNGREDFKRAVQIAHGKKVRLLEFTLNNVCETTDAEESLAEGIKQTKR